MICVSAHESAVNFAKQFEHDEPVDFVSQSVVRVNGDLIHRVHDHLLRWSTPVEMKKERVFLFIVVNVKIAVKGSIFFIK